MALHPGMEVGKHGEPEDHENAVVALTALLRSDRGADGAVLFPTFVALSRLLYADPLVAEHCATWQSFNSHFNQMVRGKRPFRPEVATALIAAVRERLRGQPESLREEWVGRLETTLRHLEASRTIRFESAPRYTSVGYPHPESIFVVCPGFPAARRTPTGRQMMRSLLSMGGILSASGFVSLRQWARYTFCFPDATEALDFWRAALEESLRDTDGALEPEGSGALSARLDETARRLGTLEHDGLLTVVAATPVLCILPFCLYTLVDGTVAATLLTYEEGVMREPVAVPAAAARRMRLLRDQILGGALPEARRVMFAECRTELVRSVLQAANRTLRRRTRKELASTI